MITLSEYNKQKAEDFRLSQENRYKTGVCCDECKVELLRVDPNAVLASWPGCYEVMCPSCNKKSYMSV